MKKEKITRTNKKLINLNTIFKTYMENCVLSSNLTNTIKCYQDDYEIINDTEDNWCFNELGYMRYKCFSQGLKDFDTIKFFRYSDCEILNGSECLKYFEEDKNILIKTDKLEKFYIDYFNGDDELDCIVGTYQECVNFVEDYKENKALGFERIQLQNYEPQPFGNL